MTLYPKFNEIGDQLTVSYNYYGGISKELFISNGELKGQLSTVYKPDANVSSDKGVVYIKGSNFDANGLYLI